jgi:hypothetical protein
MKLYKELSEAISETIEVTQESDEFKTRLSKLIENYFENSYTDRDINEVIEMTSVSGELSNGD